VSQPAAVTRARVRSNTYADSVALMRITSALTQSPGVLEAAVVMATELNRQVLADSGLLVEEVAHAGPNDLVVVVRAADCAAADAALTAAEVLLSQRQAAASGPAAALPPRSIRSATRRAGGGANLAFVSVPGPYAAAEAWQALLQGLHVFLFSDNVPIEEEVALKRYARDHDLLVMGPDCGTGIVNGVGLGFANDVLRGPVGVIGASGTGMQEITVLLHRYGRGVSQAIGTGGRDLHDEVGGITTLQALELLRDDPATEAIMLVSKPPSPAVAERVLRASAETGKPVVACLLGAALEPPDGVRMATSLYDAVRPDGPSPMETLPEPVGRPSSRWQVRGLFCGGTLCDEARLIVGGEGHLFVDFGDDRYTRGRAHPMIDPTLRDQAILEAAAAPEVAVILFDVILGYGAHPDPAGALAPVLERVRERTAADGRSIRFVAHVLGTHGDPQDLDRQEEVLSDAGVELFESSSHAAHAARAIVEGAPQ
jgi:FdrA protein